MGHLRCAGFSNECSRVSTHVADVASLPVHSAVHLQCLPRALTVHVTSRRVCSCPLLFSSPLVRSLVCPLPWVAPPARIRRGKFRLSGGWRCSSSRRSSAMTRPPTATAAAAHSPSRIPLHTPPTTSRRSSRCTSSLSSIITIIINSTTSTSHSSRHSRCGLASRAATAPAKARVCVSRTAWLRSPPSACSCRCKAATLRATDVPAQRRSLPSRPLCQACFCAPLE